MLYTYGKYGNISSRSIILFIINRGKPVNMDKPILLRIIMKTGETIAGARLQYQAPKIPGFLAIESQRVKYATMYIALDNIASFTVLNDEAKNIPACFPE